jgi:3-carboxy-cis,cis-muconate cycloisomerase
MSGDHALLSPGLHRAAGAVDDAAVVASMLRVEVAWLRAFAAVGAVDHTDADAVAAVVAEWRVDLDGLRAETEAAGNPVVPLVRELRAAVHDERIAALVHRGLTSQDVLDTALVLLSRDALARVGADLGAVTQALAALAAEHRRTTMVGRTLTQHAVPVTFGLKAAQWLSGVLDAREQLDATLASLPVQCGGAAGTLALAAELTADPVAAAAAFAEELGLVWPGLPWHTNRAPITRIGDTLVGACDALGVVAADVTLLARPEVAEVREGAVPGRGGSSTMPHKRNPVLSVLVRSAALQAPLLAAQLHVAAGQAVDERPDGAWHSEWPALRRLLEVGITAASQTAELASGLQVETAAMKARVAGAAHELLAERGGTGAPGDYLGAAAQFVDVVLARVPEGGPQHG